MKIEGDPCRIQPGAPDLLGRPATAPSPGRPSGGPIGRADRLEISEHAQMVRAAVETATSLPAIRQGVVEQMRALLDGGHLGTDASRLADALIYRWLTTP